MRQICVVFVLGSLGLLCLFQVYAGASLLREPLFCGGVLFCGRVLEGYLFDHWGYGKLTFPTQAKPKGVHSVLLGIVFPLAVGVNSLCLEGLPKERVVVAGGSREGLPEEVKFIIFFRVKIFVESLELVGYTSLDSTFGNDVNIIALLVGDGVLAKRGGIVLSECCAGG